VIPRANCLRLSVPTIKSNITIQIVSLTIIDCPAKGLFTKGYTSYKIHSKVWPSSSGGVPSDSSSPKAFPGVEYYIQRRYSEFVTLFTALQREFAHCIMPLLPKKSLNLEKKGERETEERKRYLHIWLQYVVMHPKLQCSNSLKMFLTDIRTITLPSYWLTPNDIIDNADSDEIIYEGASDSSSTWKNASGSDVIPYSATVKSKYQRDIHLMGRYSLLLI
jgi:hypothetical protein